MEAKLSTSKAELRQQVQAWCDLVAMLGIKLNVKNYECLTADVDDTGSITTNGTALIRATNFNYPASPKAPNEVVRS